MTEDILKTFSNFSFIISDLITVTAAIILKGSKILIARRAPEKHMGGYWEFPGGKVENEETPEECLKREIKEELAIDIEVVDFFMENKHHYHEKSLLLKAYFCKHFSGEVILNDHDKIIWVYNSELINYDFAPADIPFIEALLKRTS